MTNSFAMTKSPISAIILLFFMFFIASKGNAQNFTEDFGTGYDTYDLSPATTTFVHGSQGNCPPQKPDDGKYIITSNTGQEEDCKISMSCGGPCGNRAPGDLFFPGWYTTLKDHTGNPNGRFLLVNGDLNPSEFYRRTVTGLVPGNSYKFSSWLANILSTTTGCTPANPVNVNFEIYDGATLIAQLSTSAINAVSLADVWKSYGISFDAPNSGTVTLVMRNKGLGGCGNDLAIDDISFVTCVDPVVKAKITGPTTGVINTSYTFDGSTSTTTIYGVAGTMDGYAWKIKNSVGTVLASGTNTAISYSFASTGTYTVELTATDGPCSPISNTATHTIVIVNCNPIADAGSAGTIYCNPATVNLNGGASKNTAGGTTGLTYAWTTTDGTIDANANSATPTVSKAGTYKLVITETSTSCTNSAQVTVSANTTKPTVSIAPPAQLSCTAGSSVTLTASGTNITYDWGGGTTTATKTVTAVGTYTVTVTDNTNKCTQTSSASVTLNGLAPVPVIATPGVLTCAVGSSVTLNGGGSTQNGGGTNLAYAWSGGGTGTTKAVTVAGTYTLTVTDNSNQCTNSTSAVVNLNGDKPTATIDPPAKLTCTTTSITLTAHGASTGLGTGPILYGWGDPLAPTVSQTLPVSATGTYTVTVADQSNSCTSSVSVTVSQNKDNPTIAISTPTTLTCKVLNTDLDADGVSTGAGTGPLGYAWSTTATTDKINVTSIGTYTVTVTDQSNGCSASTNKTVSENKTPPVANAGNDATLTCGTTTMALNGANSTPTGAVTYSWSTNVTSGGTTATPTISAANTYTLTVTSTANGCSHSDEVVISADNNAPIAAAGSDKTIDCVNTSVNIGDASTNSGTGYTVTWIKIGSPTSISSQPIITRSDTGTFRLTVLNTTNNCSSIDFVTISTNSIIPSPTIAAPKVLTCTLLNQSLTLTPNAGASPSYAWSTASGNFTTGGSSTTTQNPQIDKAGTYIVTVTNTINNCTNTANVVITENKITPSAAVTSTSMCAGDAAKTITASSNATVTYAWQNMSETTAAISKAPLNTTTYTVVVTNPTNGCTNSANGVITVNQKPLVSLSENQTVCVGTQATLTATVTTASSGHNYAWSDLSTTTDILTKTPSLAGTIIYTVSITDAEGCTATTNGTITGIPQPQPPKVSPKVACYKSQNGVGLSISSPLSSLAYNWYLVTSPSTYELIVEDSIAYFHTGLNEVFNTNPDSIITIAMDARDKIAGCLSEKATTTISPALQPDAEFSFTPESPIYVNETVFFTNLTTPDDGIFEYIWKFGINSGWSNQKHPTNTFNSESDNYIMLYVTNPINGCIDTVSHFLRVNPLGYIWVPKAFTPNGDIFNDMFLAKHSDRVEIITFNMRIYNQWGLFIGEFNNIMNGWDGRWKGQEQPEGNYTYVIIATGLLENGKTQTFKEQGVFSLLR